MHEWSEGSKIPICLCLFLDRGSPLFWPTVQRKWRRKLETDWAPRDNRRVGFKESKVQFDCSRRQYPIPFEILMSYFLSSVSWCMNPVCLSNLLSSVWGGVGLYKWSFSPVPWLWEPHTRGEVTTHMHFTLVLAGALPVLNSSDQSHQSLLIFYFHLV